MSSTSKLKNGKKARAASQCRFGTWSECKTKANMDDFNQKTRPTGSGMSQTGIEPGESKYVVQRKSLAASGASYYLRVCLLSVFLNPCSRGSVIHKKQIIFIRTPHLKLVQLMFPDYTTPVLPAPLDTLPLLNSLG
ncbi:hypothetical protein FB45DRAFT_871311 [Roridomyces roridus]|uniref:Uncharacterized protein n=1 Tax=Roridomyces roridus TaxID=1738132 RepID=A0AAD7BGG4_9AGAR|nr:hypothetical protein FB45DRAFT_871311 [Roridomyces roridus]